MYENMYSPYSNYNIPQIPMYRPPVQQQAPQPSPPVQEQQPVRKTNCDWVFVSGIQQVRDSVLMPGQNIYFLDNNNSMIYQKISEGEFGTKIKAFKLTEVNIDNLSQSGLNEASGAVSKEEIQSLAQRVAALEQQLQNREVKTNESISSQSDISAF